MSSAAIQSLVRAIAWNNDVHAVSAGDNAGIGLAIFVQDHLCIGPPIEQRFYWRVIDYQGNLTDYYRGFSHLHQPLNPTQFDTVVTNNTLYLALAATKLPTQRAAFMVDSHLFPAPSDVMQEAIAAMSADGQDVLAGIGELTSVQRVGLLRKLKDQRDPVRS